MAIQDHDSMNGNVGHTESPCNRDSTAADDSLVDSTEGFSVVSYRFMLKMTGLSDVYVVIRVISAKKNSCRLSYC